ncbi:uncharacterized protein EDB91DRAFT_1252891 [Suillus paluster]|uniref:uncharacterized protein n=1 Tax=Suillus paluster TaxID=48578 RepID=UPI001B879DEA|nr:uncharacterized protein EDB91DRAFT_1252891 [Suillus paluster]KAG1729853.1 hypothetical protein EDB91DRAFT_1252891 [Suillus paluster]
MGKLDHIPELMGLDTYFAWKHEVAYSLGTEDLWCHVMDKVDPDDILGNALYKPTPVIPSMLTATEVKTIREWLIEDLKAKAIIIHKVLARDAWKTLEDHFGHTDISS